MRHIPNNIFYYYCQGRNDEQVVSAIVDKRRLTKDEIRNLLYSMWEHHLGNESWDKRVKCLEPAGALICANQPITDARLIRCCQKLPAFEITFSVKGESVKVRITNDTLLDIIYQGGIGKDGLIRTGLVWAWTKLGYPKLAALESDEYKNYRRLDERSSNNIIPKRELIPGHMYETFNGSLGIYLGNVRTVAAKNYWYVHGPMIYWSTNTRRMLWYASTELQKGKMYTSMFTSDIDLDCLRLNTSHSYRMDCGKVVVGSLETVQRIVTKTALSMISKIPDSRYHQQRTLSDFAGLANMVPPTEEPVIVQVVRDVIKAIKVACIYPNTSLNELPEFLTHPNWYIREEAVKHYKKLTGKDYED